MALDPRQLRAFLAIVDAGSLGMAAEALHVTQPALSRMVRRLEIQLGVSLFERRSTGMELTNYGEALLPHATVLSAEGARALEQINSLRGLGQGTLRIGSVASAAIVVLPPVLDRILTQWPNLHVQITEAVEDILETALANNSIDVVISGPIRESEEIMLASEHEFTDRYSVISAATHPLQKRGDLVIEDLASERWVMPPEEAEPRKRFAALAAKLGVAPPRVAVETRYPAVIKALVAGTKFLGWLPAPLFAAEESAGLIKRLRVQHLSVMRRFFVFRRRRNAIPPPVQKFLDALRIPHGVTEDAGHLESTPFASRAGNDT
jgi:DNA-binding transcriptional LysR family regulator